MIERRRVVRWHFSIERGVHTVDLRDPRARVLVLPGYRDAGEAASQTLLTDEAKLMHPGWREDERVNRDANVFWQLGESRKFFELWVSNLGE